jgi:hypothetical protein
MIPTNLNSAEEERVKQLEEKICSFIAEAGLKIERLDVPEQGFYDREGRRIVLSTREFKSPLPRKLENVFTLAHELGHHGSQNRHAYIGRIIDMDKAFDVLFEEKCAWDMAIMILEQAGMREEIFWDAFNVAMGCSLATYTHDFATTYNIQELLLRKGIRCPSCRSDKIAVLGLESRMDLAVSCFRCGTHSRPHRTVQAMTRALRPRASTFTHLCNCKNKTEAAP